jgi:hypothetical protein
MRHGMADAPWWSQALTIPALEHCTKQQNYTAIPAIQSPDFGAIFLSVTSPLEGRANTPRTELPIFVTG